MKIPELRIGPTESDPRGIRRAVLDIVDKLNQLIRAFNDLFDFVETLTLTSGVKGDTGPRGPTGATGPAGPAGSGASTATTLVRGIVKVDNNSVGDPIALTVAGHGAAADPHPVYAFDTDPRFTNARTPLAHTHPETDVVGLVADLAAKATLGQLVGSYDLGSALLTAGKFLFHYKRLTLSGAERLTLQGNTDALILDLGMNAPVIMGTPKSFTSSFTVPTEYVLDQLRRLCLLGGTRATLQGTADLVLTDDFGSRSRIVLAGRG